MNIFYKRPLCLILCVTLGGFAFFQSLGVTTASVLISLLSLTFVFTFIPPLIRAPKPMLIRIVIGTLLISFLLSFLYFDLRFDAHSRFDGESVTVHGIITDMKTSGSTTEIDVDADNVSEKPLSSYKLKAFLDSEEYYNFSIGSEVSIVGRISDFDFSASSSDTKSYYNSMGFSGVITDISEFKLLSSGNYDIAYYFKSYRESITRRIILNSDTETGGLLGAILLGDKSYLSGQISLDFSRIGISHILALSGMHLAILVLGIEKLFSVIGINKRLRYVITITLTLLYMALTGFPVSVVRAGLMLIIRSFLHLFSRTHDSITSLSIAVFIICLIEPYAVYDTSLWLSAFATLGILIYSEYSKGSVKYEKLRGRLGRAIMLSVFAISSTLIFTTFSFSSISAFAPVTTVVFSVLVEIFLYIGMLVPIFGELIPIRVILIPLGEFIGWLAGVLSDINYAFSGMGFIALKILVVALTVAFILFAILRINRKRRAALILVSMYAITVIMSSALAYISENEKRINYEAYNEQEIITFTNDGNITVFDVANYRNSTANNVLDSVSNQNIMRIDNYFMLRYSYNMSDALTRLCGNVKVDRIYLPLPQSADEEMLLLAAAKSLENYRVHITIYEAGTLVETDSLKVLLSHRGELSDSATSIIFTVIHNSKAYSYLTRPVLDEEKAVARSIMSQSESIIIGCHGNGNMYKFNYELEIAENIVFASDKIEIKNSLFDYYEKRDTRLYFIPDRVDLIR